MIRLLVISLVLAGLPFLGIGQQTLSLDQFMQIVRANHPVSKQADLLLDQGQAKLRKARGSFDPKLQADLREKDFDDKDYYRLLNAGLKVPTWFGIEVKTGIDQSSGLFVNPEDNLPAGGLWYAGVSVPVGRGLFIDQRRATLRQAKIYAESTVAERRKFLNDLYFDAVVEYWEWAAAWNELQVYREAVELASVRYRGVVGSFQNGNKPAIDTVEALLQVQNRTLMRDQALLNYQKATLSLSNYLWSEEGYPLEVTDSVVPPNFAEFTISDATSLDSLEAIVTGLPESHPDMQLYGYKLETIDVDRRLARENLKPELRLNYNALTESVSDAAFSAASLQNYKWGFEFSFPLMLRKQRGDLQLANVKMKSTELGQEQKLLELQNKVRAYYAMQVNTAGQVGLSRSAVTNYRRLVAGEQQRFAAGESSLFLVNSREMKMIEARMKLISLVAKYETSIRGLDWAAGSLAE